VLGGEKDSAQGMMESMDDIVKTIASALMLAHIAAFVWAGVLRRGIAPVLALNILVSVGVIAYWIPRISELFHYVDAMQGFVGFELAVMATSLLAVGRFRVPRALIWIEFAVHALFVAATLAFMFTFKLTRLV
jgi:hypothetical protein